MSLTFDSLDRRVIDGDGDQIAATIDDQRLTYAQLVERSAALAGGLRLLGIESGTLVVLQVTGLDLIVSVWALARLHARPSAASAIPPPWAEISGDPAGVVVDGARYTLVTIEMTGRNDPAPAPRTDPDGYCEELAAAFPSIIAARA